MKGTSVTAVLIGTETSTRDWVIYEIQESFKKGNGMLGIYVHNCKDNYRNTCFKGNNPFAELVITDENGNKTYLSEIYSTYDWIDDDGYNNFATWVETAAKQVGK